jgi:hypothetical protein
VRLAASHIAGQTASSPKPLSEVEFAYAALVWLRSSRLVLAQDAVWLGDDGHLVDAKLSAHTFSVLYGVFAGGGTFLGEALVIALSRRDEDHSALARLLEDSLMGR